jgi:hypothetical protein
MDCTNRNACGDTEPFLTTTATTKRKYVSCDRTVVSPERNGFIDEENDIHKRLRTTNELVHSESALIESSSPILI